MGFVDSVFLFEFLPGLLAIFFLTRAAAAVFGQSSRRAAAAANAVLVAASLVFIGTGPLGIALLSVAAFTFVMAALIDRSRLRPGGRGTALTCLAAALVANGVMLTLARLRLDGRAFMFAGPSILACYAIAYVMDVYRGQAATTDPLTAALYLVQFPVLPGGPIVRYRDFSHHLQLDRGVGLGAVTYGVRRVVIGLVKVALVAGTLAVPADQLFALPAARLSAGAAWLAAVCVALQIYFQFSGYADIAIGLGRMLGLRYPENFRRPYVADSVREFWRRWNITSITWLRDYLSLPIAGREAPTPRLFLNIVIGFCLVGVWHGAGANVLIWAVYSGTWLALEAVGFGKVLDRLPRPLRHAYLLAVVTIGWVVLRADTPAHALGFLQAMAGLHPGPLTASRVLTTEVWVALVVALVGAGPMVPWISRWRVTLDAITAAVAMMLTAVSLFIWRGGTLMAEAFKPLRPRK